MAHPPTTQGTILSGESVTSAAFDASLCKGLLCYGNRFRTTRSLYHIAQGIQHGSTFVRQILWDIRVLFPVYYGPIASYSGGGFSL
jgi:hypothetical protein